MRALVIFLICLALCGAARADERAKGWLGATVKDLAVEDAAKLGMESPHGVIVTRRAAGAPAEKARLEAGDVRRPSPPPRGQALARRPTLPSKRFSLAPRRTINLISVPFAARSASKPALFSNSTRSRLTMPSQAPAVIFVPMGRTLTSSAG